MTNVIWSEVDWRLALAVLLAFGAIVMIMVAANKWLGDEEDEK